MTMSTSAVARFQPVLRKAVPWAGLLGLCLSILIPIDGVAKEKPPRPPRPEPELKIVQLNIAPTPYTPGNGPLRFDVTVQLPKEMESATLLEVTSLISSPSRTSLRFLTHRQSVEAYPAVTGEHERPKVSIALLWDGQDHRNQLASAGTYSYEVRIKLLTNGEKGPRTTMVAWPKRGTVKVK
ncbi:MAG TPA: hypothetical protein VFX56_00155 [Nitrospira sp.]|nr:hypothetical protein [Nitrospira sp.]